VEGSYSIDGVRLHFHPQRLVWWDLFYGKDSPVQVVQPYPYGTLFDSTRFEITADRLTLRYLSYPFDALVTTTLELTRTENNSLGLSSAKRSRTYLIHDVGRSDFVFRRPEPQLLSPACGLKPPAA
jgi:hypothetical protein